MNSMALVGIQSGFDRLGEKGRAEYKDRNNAEEGKGGEVDGEGGRRR